MMKRFKKPTIEDQLFDLKMASKSMLKNHKKCMKEHEIQKKKLKEAIQKGSQEGAKIYAGNAIRKKNEAGNFLTLASRLDGVCSKLEAATRMNEVTNTMKGLTVNLAHALGAFNITEVGQVMDTFEQEFDMLDTRAQFVEQAMNATVASSTPQDEVDMLIQQVGDEHSLDVATVLGRTGIKNEAVAKSNSVDPLAAKFEGLDIPK